MAITKSKYFLTALWGNLKLIIYFHGALYTFCQAEDQLLITWRISRFLSKINFGFSFFVCLQILTLIHEFPWQEWQADSSVPCWRHFSKPLVRKSISPALQNWAPVMFCWTIHSLWAESLVDCWVSLWPHLWDHHIALVTGNPHGCLSQDWDPQNPICFKFLVHTCFSPAA